MPHVDRSFLFVLLLVTGVSGCGPRKTVVESDPELKRVEPLEPTETTNPVQKLREELKLNPGEGEIRTDGGKITKVYLERTGVRDISPLKGLPLEQLYLSYTKVRDLAPLKGMPLKQLNLVGTPVSDISVVESMKADGLTLWLNDTQVNDVSPLKGKPLLSLDLTGTPVTDLSPLAGMKSLRRLNLERSAVTDLTPLKGLQLERIVFDPAKITKGLDAVREMDSLKHMHTRFPGQGERWFSPEEFWKQASAGTFKE